MTPEQRHTASEDAVRDQLREERGRVPDEPSADGGNGGDSAERDRGDAVAEVEAARSAEARMATESASAVEAADAGEGDTPGVVPGTAASDSEAEAELAAEPPDDDPEHLKAE